MTSYGRPQAVLLSVEAYERIADEEVIDLRALEEDFDALLDRMQRSGHRSGTDALFEMTGRELGDRRHRRSERRGQVERGRRGAPREATTTRGRPVRLLHLKVGRIRDFAPPDWAKPILAAVPKLPYPPPP